MIAAPDVEAGPDKRSTLVGEGRTGQGGGGRPALETQNGHLEVLERREVQVLPTRDPPPTDSIMGTLDQVKPRLQGTGPTPPE